MKTLAVAFETQPESRRRIEEAVAGLAQVAYREDPEFLAKLPMAEVLIVRGWRGQFPPGAMAGMRRLEMVQCLFAGVDHLPWEEIPATATVCSNAGAQADAVAEHALALLLAAAKNIPFHDAALRAGRFPQEVRSRRIEGLTLGILGYGHIGRSVAERAKSFGMRILALNRSGGGEGPVDAWLREEEGLRLAAESDVVVCCLPLTKRTPGVIGAAFLAAMKPESILVNVSRGKVIDEGALYDHLRRNPGFTAALDVWWRYPREDGGHPFTQPYFDLANVVMTPHVAFSATGNTERVLGHALENVLRHLRGEAVRNVAEREDYL